MKYKNREEFLNKLYNNIYGRSSNAHIRKSDSPTEKIKYLEQVERTHDIVKNDVHKMETLKQFYYDKYIISRKLYELVRN